MKEESYIEEKEDEIPARPISFKSSFWLVLAIHLFGGIGLLSLTGGTKTANAEDKKFLESKEAQFAGVEQPTPTPTPEPVKEEPPPKQSPKDNWPKGKPKIVYPVKPTITKEYVVKNGDTLYAISKRYKLNFERLKQINNIKDPQKIFVGQKLKFL
jgi:5'-nucleotidase/UDP-sugar diphosphatase